MSKQFLILGGNGFIGNNLCRSLVQKNNRVIIFDRFLPKVKLVDVKYVQGDFFSDDDIYDIVMKSDVIYHAVSTINPGNSNDKYLMGYSGDLVQTIKIISWIKDTNKTFIFLSSGGTVYGYQESHPIKEDALPQPINHYGNIKLCIENSLRIFHLQNSLNVRIARIANPFGPGQDYTSGVGFVDAALKRSLEGKNIEIWGDGENIRDYVYIDDVCECLVALAEYEGNECIFNISSGTGISLNQITEEIERLGIPVHVTYMKNRSVDVRKIILDNSKIKDVVSVTFSPFEKGIGKYHNYLKNN